MNLDDTIVAQATPPGRGALATVRLAGPQAFTVAEVLAPGLNMARAREAQLLTLRDASGSRIDQALVSVFPAPHSYSGDDTVEFSTHGGVIVPARVVAACIAAGARLALPGEFSRRAVLAGKLDLLQAEGVADLIDATAPAQADQAIRQLDGHTSAAVASLRDTVIATSALLAYAIDFPEEDDGPLELSVVRAKLEQLQQQLRAIASTAQAGIRVRSGALVVVAGQPNVGKSSLFNALLGRDRVIVSPHAGTTRDAVEADANLDGWPVTLVDTAGLRRGAEEIEAIGIAITDNYLGRADLILWCGQTAEDLQLSERSFSPIATLLAVRTKSDLATHAESAGADVSVSAVTGEGIAELRRLIADRLFHAVLPDPATPILTRARHASALGEAIDAVAESAAELQRAEPVLAAAALARAAAALAEIIGGVDREDVFDRLFAGFCVGK